LLNILTNVHGYALELQVVVCEDRIVGMPDEDGYMLIRRVRALAAERGGEVPALALTAFARAEDRAQAVQCGYQSHLSKPVQAMDLVSSIAELAGRNPSRRPGAAPSADAN
jgi:DNA-binding response OmpR family regulator